MEAEREPSQLRARAPTFRLHRSGQDGSDQHGTRARATSLFRRERRGANQETHPRIPSVYTGSYKVTSPILRPGLLPPAGNDSPRTSVSHLQLKPLLEGLGEDIKTYGLHELRDGLFDATFIRPAALEERHAEEDESSESEGDGMLSRQLRGLRNVVTDVTTTRSGVRLVKSFLGYFICYLLCLIPSTKAWLGPYSYIIVLSALFNHPGRSIGSQLDGAFMTCAGAVIGLLWAAFAVWLSTASPASQNGVGAVVAPFLVIFAFVTGWLRCVLSRLYQAILATGLAFFYMALSENYTDPASISPIIWRRFAAFMIPWALGQAVCLVVCTLLFPSAGNRPLALSFHAALDSIRNALVLPRPDSRQLDSELAYHFVQVSQATRDFSMDLTISRFSSGNCALLRNHLQGVLRALLALRPDSNFFAELSQPPEKCDGAAAIVSQRMAAPTWEIVKHSQKAIDAVDHVIMDTSRLIGYSDLQVFSLEEIRIILDSLRQARSAYDCAELSLNEDPALSSMESSHSDVVDMLTFMQPIRQVADKVILLLEQALALKESPPGWKLQLPTYPWSKALFRMNPTVRHDRGGLTAAHYFRSKRQLERTMNELQHRSWKPLNESAEQSRKPSHDKNTTGRPKSVFAQTGLRHAIWLIIHRLQGFETRFALKKTLVCTLLSIPAFLPQSSAWWFAKDCWWAVVTVWIMMHPRIGGNLTDLWIRCLSASVGALWGGLAHGARNGNPFVMAAFMTVFVAPMMYRYTISNHPRSGVIGCISFTVVSLIEYDDTSGASIIDIAWTRGLSFLVGTSVAITVNWILWPFIARHELRKSLAAMILHCALIYRRVLSEYIYYEEGHEPDAEDITRSEMLEGRLREGFVRIRQLMSLTKHELRLRGPFDPRPYDALINRCESFFDRLIDVRQASLFFKQDLMRRSDNETHHLAALRRDAAGSILMLLYALAGALRERRPLPRYLPSSALARQRLLDTMDLVQAEQAERDAQQGGKGNRGSIGKSWADVYRFAYSLALTDCVDHVQQLVVHTRRIVGEVGLHRAPGFAPS